MPLLGAEPQTNGGVMSDIVMRRRHGPEKLSADRKRNFCVSVRMNIGELAGLDNKRGRVPRGEWLRLCAEHKLPPSIPPLNRQAWIELSRSASNLNQLSKKLNAGDEVDVAELRQILADFRLRLLGGGYESHEEG